MLFLGKVYVLSFNPILPHQSGSDTTRMKYRLAASVRHFIFGSDTQLNFKKESKVNGMVVVSKIPLPEIQCEVVIYDVSWSSFLLAGFIKDLTRKFKNRRDSEYRYLQRTKERFHSGESAPAPKVVESPKRPVLAKGEKQVIEVGKQQWRSGPARRSSSQFVSGTSATLKRKFNFEVDIKVTMSPSKRPQQDTPMVSKRSLVQPNGDQSAGMCLFVVGVFSLSVLYQESFLISTLRI